jgi:hypothetical protein
MKPSDNTKAWHASYSLFALYLHYRKMGHTPQFSTNVARRLKNGTY